MFYVSERLADLEILYLTNLGPKLATTLLRELNSVFDCSLSFLELERHVNNLKSEGLIRSFDLNADQVTNKESEIYGITSQGIRQLQKAIENLYRIVLTMQLRFNQALVYAQN